MELSEAIARRRSVRQFEAEGAVDETTVRRILEAGIAAPSAGNGQSWHFVVVRDAAIRHRLAFEAGHQRFIEEAPVVIVVCADLELAESHYGLRGRNTYSLQETAAAVENMLLTITSLRLGSCWVGAFDEAKASEILGLQPRFRPLAMLPVGVPAEDVRETPLRRKIEEVTTLK